LQHDLASADLAQGPAAVQIAQFEPERPRDKCRKIRVAGRDKGEIVLGYRQDGAG
jgi:hypothetical protein